MLAQTISSKSSNLSSGGGPKTQICKTLAVLISVATPNPGATPLVLTPPRRRPPPAIHPLRRLPHSITTRRTTAAQSPYHRPPHAAFHLILAPQPLPHCCPSIPRRGHPCRWFGINLVFFHVIDVCYG